MPDIFDDLSSEEESGLLGKIGKTGAQLGKSALAGATGTYGDILSLLGLSGKKNLTPGQEALYRAEFEAPESQLGALQDEDILPRFSRLPTTEEDGEFIGENQPSNIAERYAQRIGRPLGGGAVLGASPATLGTLGGAGAIGQSSRELGAPEWVSNSLELLSLFGPSALAKHAYGNKSLKKLVEYARKQGLTEEEIAGLVTGDRKAKALGKLAKKSGKTERLLGSINEKAGTALDNVKKTAAGLPQLSGEAAGELGGKFADIVEDLRKTVKPSPDKQSAINFITEAHENLMNQGATPESLINFCQDINAAANWNTMRGGKKILARLKEPILDTLRQSSPELAQDFELANSLYSRSKFLSNALKPSTIDNVLDKGPVGAIMVSLALGNPGIISKYIGTDVFRTLSREMLFNPRYQNISKKMLNALKDNKPKAAESFLQLFKDEIKKDHPDIFEELENSKIFQ